MTDDPQLSRIFSELTEMRGSMNAQFKSIQETIYSNNTEILQRLTSSERWQDEHEKADVRMRDALTERDSEHGAQLKALALEVGRVDGALGVRVGTAERFAAAIQTSVSIWKWVFGAAVAGFGIVEALAHGKH